jgi:hypothetical protein
MEENAMTRTTTPTPLRAASTAHSHPVEELIKKLLREGSTPSSGVTVTRPVSIVEDDAGADPYNHTGRFRKIFK